MATTPTAAEIREWSKVDWADPDVDYPPPVGSDPDPLQLLVDRASAYVTFVTARGYDSHLPTSLEPLLNQAVQMRTEQLAQMGKADNVETAGDFDLLSAFTAGAYSETRRSMADANEAKAGMLNPWPELNRLLWLLLGLVPGETNADVDDRRDYWRYILGMQPNAPAWAVVEMNWQRTLQPDRVGAYGIGESAPYYHYGL